MALIYISILHMYANNFLILSLLKLLTFQVKILYVRNLMLSTTEETIQKFMNSQLGKENAVERVKKIKDYAFVHFKDRDDALQAMDLTNSKTLFSISPVLRHLSHSSDLRPRNINWQDWKYVHCSWFSSITVKTCMERIQTLWRMSS